MPRPHLVPSLLVLVTLGVPAAAETRATYSVTLLGLPLARAELTLDSADGRWRAKLDWRTVGLVGLVSTAKGELSADGRLAERRLDPAHYRMTGGTPKKPTAVDLTFSGGDVGSATATPPSRPSPDLVPLTDRHRKDVTDPLTAALIPAPGAVCGRTLPIFDGWTRFDVRLAPGGNGPPTPPPGIAGPVETCAVRWVPIAGHRAEHPNVRRMADNRDIEVSLGRPEALPFRIPVHAAAATPFGRAELTLERIDTGAAPATRRPGRRADGPVPGRDG